MVLYLVFKTVYCNSKYSLKKIEFDVQKIK